jgi:hypothetical protein
VSKFESVEAVIVTLGQRLALVARPLPVVINDEDVAKQNGVVLINAVPFGQRIEARYKRDLPALQYHLDMEDYFGITDREEMK